MIIGLKTLLVLTVVTCQEHDHHVPDLELTYEIAQDLASLPLECYNKMYPFKFNNVWNEASEVAEHQNYVPIFSGCFDWHSSVHGHWLLASLLNRYPDSQLAERIVEVFDHQFQVCCYCFARVNSKATNQRSSFCLCFDCN